MGTHIALVLGALGFALMGIGALAFPAKVTMQFGIATLNADGRNEVRAVYGGFGLVISGLLLMAAVDGTHRTGISLTVGMALLGMALGRIVSGIVDRAIGRWPLTYMIVELMGGAMLIYAAF